MKLFKKALLVGCNNTDTVDNKEAKVGKVKETENKKVNTETKEETKEEVVEDTTYTIKNDKIAL